MWRISNKLSISIYSDFCKNNRNPFHHQFIHHFANETPFGILNSITIPSQLLNINEWHSLSKIKFKMVSPITWHFIERPEQINRTWGNAFSDLTGSSAVVLIYIKCPSIKSLGMHNTPILCEGPGGIGFDRSALWIKGVVHWRWSLKLA